MSLSRLTTWLAGTLLIQCRNSPLSFGRHDRKYVSFFTDRLFSPSGFNDKVITVQLGLRHHAAYFSSASQCFGFSSSASAQPNEKETAHSGNEQQNGATNQSISVDDTPDQTEAPTSKEKTKLVSATKAQSMARGRRRSCTKRIAFSDSESDLDSESNIARDDLVKLVEEKKRLLATNQEELQRMKNKVLLTLAEMENVKERTTRESENAKKFAIQNFAKSLLDVADNLGWASSVAKEGLSKMDANEGASGAVQLLKTLLEGVEMTEKQLLEVFRKFGLERYDPMNEEFDPNRHNAVYKVPDASMPSDHVAVVLKVGYMLHDRVIRPADVGVSIAAND